jgi:hypothetical protein
MEESETFTQPGTQPIQLGQWLADFHISTTGKIAKYTRQSCSIAGMHTWFPLGIEILASKIEPLKESAI